MANDPKNNDPLAQMHASREAERRAVAEDAEKLRKMEADSKLRILNSRRKTNDAIAKTRLESWTKKY